MMKKFEDADGKLIGYASVYEIAGGQFVAEPEGGKSVVFATREAAYEAAPALIAAHKIEATKAHHENVTWLIEESAINDRTRTYDWS